MRDWIEGGAKRVTAPTMVQAKAARKAEERHSCHKGGMVKLISFSWSADF